MISELNERWDVSKPNEFCVPFLEKNL